MKIISVVNQKGGVGKTTTAYNTGAYFFLTGKKVLFIDLDPQGNLSYTLNSKKMDKSIYEVLTRTSLIEAAIQKTEMGDLVPSSMSLALVDIHLSKEIGKEQRLREALEPIKDNYDYIVIDTPPALGTLSVNALTASTGVIITAQADIYSLQGISQLYETIEAIKEYCNPKLEIYGILLTRYSNRSVLSREVAETLEKTAKNINTRLFNTKIRENISLKEAQAKQKDIFTYDNKSNGAKDYQEFIKELIKVV